MTAASKATQLAAGLAASVLAVAFAAPATAGDLAWKYEEVGPAPYYHPTITNVQIGDVDGDGAAEVVVCDAQKQAVFSYRRKADGTWEEKTLGENLVAPAHATIVDLDGDGDNDVVVSVMGNLFPDDGVIGSLVLLENVGGSFEQHVLLDDVRRVADAQPGDFDGDGDLDLAVAVFGYARGEILWLENRGDLKFRDHLLMAAPGTIHVPVADFDGDGDLDIAAIVSQDEEEAWGFENLGGGKFKPRQLWMTLNFDIGSAGLVKSDLDGDGDVDLLLPVGDNLEDIHSIPQPYHGCLWLENQGAWKFAAQRIVDFPGCYAAAADDLDGDGDQDVVLVSEVNDWDDASVASLAWAENDGKQKFTLHTIATKPVMLVTVACGDINGDKRPDIVAGGLHIYAPYDRTGRVSSWLAVDPGAGDKVETAAPARAVAVRPPLPNLTLVDPLTCAELERLRDRLTDKIRDERDFVGDWMELGEAYYAFGFFPAARACFEEAIRKDPKSFDANFMRGVCWSRLGKMAAAAKQLEQTLTLARGEQKSWVEHEIGRCYLRLEDGKRAEAAFVAAGRYDASLAELAKLRIRLGRPKEAREPLDQLAIRQSQATPYYLLEARLAAALGDASAEQKWREKAEYSEQRFPPDALPARILAKRAEFGVPRLLEQAERLASLESWGQAADLVEKAVAAQDRTDAIFLHARAELKRKQPEKAIAAMEEFMQNRGETPAAMILLGDGYLAAERPQEALATWEAAARLRSSAGLHERLAKQYEAVGRTDDAAKERAWRIRDNGIEALRHGKADLARPDLGEAVQRDPNDAKAWFYLGECRRLTGDAVAAKKAYAKTVELNPNHGRALAALEALGK